MTEKKIKICNGRVLAPFGIIPKGTVLIFGEKITAISEGDIEISDVLVIDAEGKYISPGFIDIHIHGGGGADFMDGDAEAFLKIAETHARYGTTAMTPTTLSSDTESLFNSLRVYEAAVEKNFLGSDFLGMHFEGPYFAMSQRGAQDPKYIRDPDAEEYKAVIASSKSIARWSAAPELKGALEFGQYLRKHGIRAAIAHTDAVYEEVLKAVESGYNIVTHLYSAMSGVSRKNAFRYAGVIESAFLIDEMFAEVIADGVHLPAPLLKLVYKIKGADRIALVTDAMRAAGGQEGESILGNKQHGIKVIVEDGVEKMPDRTSFAGSVATADRLVRNMINLAEIPLTDAVKMMTATPAAIMKISDRKGTLAKGKDADIVIFDEQINVCLTMVTGRIVFNSCT